MTPLVALVDALAAYRLVRLVVEDSITRTPRELLIAAAYRNAGLTVPSGRGAQPGYWEDRVEDDRGHGRELPKLAELISCQFCSAVYVGFGVMVARRFAPRVWAPFAEGLALAAVAALVYGVEQ